MSWRPRPNPGDMVMCRNCPHRRDDPRADYRCAETKHQPYLPPVTSITIKGEERCGHWPPRPHHEAERADQAQPALFGGDAA